MQSKIGKKINLDLVLKDVDNYCYSELSKSKFRKLEYVKNYEKLVQIHKENEEVEYLYRKFPNEFKLKIFDYYDSLKKSKIESILYEKELFYILSNIHIYSRFKNKFNSTKVTTGNSYPYLSFYVDNLFCFDELSTYLSKIIDEDGYIRNDASFELKQIKDNIKKLKNKSDQILKNIILSNSKKLSEAIVTKRNDRDVILVKPEYKNDFGGIIHDESASGNTFYVEPKENVIINNDIAILKRKEKEEILKILKEATEKISLYADELKTSLDNFAEIEFIFSKINFSISNKFEKPKIKNIQHINLKKAYNPLIKDNEVVKNDIYLDNKGHSLIITGPNTGGKTVILKTVGMCVLLTNLGLYIPASPESEIGYYENIFIDIGDEQSIENNLSTFSSHIVNIINILKEVNSNSLVLLDELCSGTDPAEGSALSMALLNEFKNKKVTVLCTTHYPEIKDYCFRSEYYKNASLEFDFDNLKPTYNFIIGLPGKSNAINISYKLGLCNNIVLEAKEFVKETEKENNIFIEKLGKNIKEYQDKLQILDEELREVKEIKNSLKNNIEEYYKYKDSLYNKLYSEFNEDIENKKEELLIIYNSIKENTNKVLKQHEFNDKISEIDKYKPLLSSNIKILEKDTKKLNIGDDVLVLKYNQRASVLDIINNNKIQIKLGHLKLFVTREEIKVIEKERENIINYSISKKNISNVSLDVNVIGKNTEDALREIEEYIDKVILMGYDNFTIIHGVGSGILKKNIAEYLKNHRYVANYRSGGQNEGGLGVTIVEIK